MNVAIWGINGKMGQTLLEEAKRIDDVNVVFGFDKSPNNNGVKLYNDISQIDEKVDVIIDFSNHQATNELLKFAQSANTPVVICSTGHTKKEMEEIKKASKKIAILLSPNMSYGANFMLKFAEEHSKDFVGKGFSVDVSETHHNAKLDRPSGTALSILDAILTSCPNLHIENMQTGKRKQDDVCVHSFRLGSETGTHEIIFSSEYETITLTHKVYSRKAFAIGAINAAYYLINKNNGIYSIKHVLKNIQK